MRRMLAAATFSAVVLMVSVTGLHALPPPMPLEERVADSDVVVAGEIVKVADEPARGDPADHIPFAREVRCTVKVTQVFKGPADLKEVEVLCPKPAPERKAPPGVQAVSVGVAFRKTAMGEKAIWMLVKTPDAEGVYKELFYHPVHEQDTAEAVAAVVKVATDPAMILKDDQAAERQRLSAAYLYLRGAVPEDALPRVRTPHPNGGVEVSPDTSGRTLLDPALVDRAVDAAVQGFATTDVHDQTLGRHCLVTIGCPLNELRPVQTEEHLRRTREQAEQDRREHQAAWAAAARRWWQEHKTKVYRSAPMGETHHEKTEKAAQSAPRKSLAVLEAEARDSLVAAEKAVNDGNKQEALAQLVKVREAMNGIKAWDDLRRKLREGMEMRSLSAPADGAAPKDDAPPDSEKKAEPKETVATLVDKALAAVAAAEKAVNEDKKEEALAHIASAKKAVSDMDAVRENSDNQKRPPRRTPVDITPN